MLHQKELRMESLCLLILELEIVYK